VRWRIRDVVKFYLATGGDQRRAGILVYQKINDALRVEFGKRKVQEVVAGERGKIMEIVKKTADERGEELGLEIVDVRIKRIDLPVEVSSAVYEGPCDVRRDDLTEESPHSAAPEIFLQQRLPACAGIASPTSVQATVARTSFCINLRPFGAGLVRRESSW